MSSFEMGNVAGSEDLCPECTKMNDAIKEATDPNVPGGVPATAILTVIATVISWILQKPSDGAGRKCEAQ